MPALRHQLPVYSPVTATALVRSGGSLVGEGEAARDRLRELLTRRFDAEQVVLVGSGTQALQLAILAALATRPGGARRVALPAFSCYDLVSAAVGADVEIALYDLDPHTLGPDLGSLSRVLGAGCPAAVIAPLYGLPVDWEAVEGVAVEHGAALIEDAAQGHGASWDGRALGALGPMSIISFGRGKGWTGGGGGALLLRGPGTAAATRTTPLAEPAHDASPAGYPVPPPASAGLRGWAVTAAQWALGRPALYGIPSSIPGLGLGTTVYHPPRAPTAMPRTCAALALATRGPSDREAGLRRAAAGEMTARLSDAGVELASVSPRAVPGWLRLPVRVPGGLKAFDDPGRALRLGLGRSYPTDLAGLAATRTRLASPPGEWPGARDLARDLVTLPTHSRVRGGDQAELARLVVAAAPSRP